MTTAPQLAAVQPDSLLGFAVLGKTAMALVMVVGVILLCYWLLRRLSPQQLAGQHLRVIGGTHVGQRERVVIVEVDDTWLVLGVTPGQVSKLHELPAPEKAADVAPVPSSNGTFAERLACALKQNLSCKVFGPTSTEPPRN